MYVFLIPARGAKGIHAVQTIIVNVVPVITTADLYMKGLNVYLYFLPFNVCLAPSNSELGP